MLYKIILMLAFLYIPLFARESALGLYVKEGLRNNLALKQKGFSLRSQLAELDEAKGMFLPSISINARYTRAGGGRVFGFPVGDLMNPVYATLNQLTNSSIFPTNLKNEVFPFFRTREHETKISLVQPLFQMEIYYNKEILSNLTQAQKAERNAYARQLVADIKMAYYNYYKTVKIIELLEKTELLLDENLRVSESLVRNNKSTAEIVLRARAELNKLEQSKAEAARDNSMAKAYFNFLLNKNQDDDIDIIQVFSQDIIQIDSIADYKKNISEAEAAALTKRPELSQLRSGIDAAGNNVSLSEAKYLPNVVLAADYGFQGENYDFKSEDDYWIASVVFQWNLFNGGQDKARTEKALYQKEILEAQYNELVSRVKLQVRQAYYDLVVAEKSIRQAEGQLILANETFNIINKKYSEGMAPQIEYLDAQNELIQAEIKVIISKQDYNIKMAEMEKAAALYNLGNEY